MASAKPGSTCPETGSACRKPGIDGQPCACQLRLGNDFWFLPFDQCLEPDEHDEQFPGFSQFGG